MPVVHFVGTFSSFSLSLVVIFFSLQVDFHSVPPTTSLRESKGREKRQVVGDNTHRNPPPFFGVYFAPRNFSER
jgi:hypothetical protein